MKRFLVGLMVLVTALGGFVLVLHGPAQAATVPNAGVWYEVVRKDNSECLMIRTWTLGEQLVTRGCDGSVHQKWLFSETSNGSGWYRVSNKYTDYCMDVAWRGTADWSNIVQANCVGTDNQLWRLNDTGDGHVEMLPQHVSKCLDISWGWAVLYGCTGGGNERFRLR